MSYEKVSNIVIVDDNSNNLELLSGILSERNYKVRKAINAAWALRAIQAAPPDLILLDITLPDMTGYEVCAILKRDPQTANIPIIFISALNDAIDKVKAFAVGGVDYICKPFEMSEILARVEAQLSVQSIRRELQRLNAELEQRVQERTHQLEQSNQALEREIAERQRIHETLFHLLRHDRLTNLPNLSYILEALNGAIAQTKENPDHQFALLVLDCDRFHQINRSLGNKLGDQFLIQLGERLKHCLPAEAILAHSSRDEFMIFLKSVQDEGAVKELIQTFQQVLQSPFQLDEHTVFVSINIGIVMGSSHYGQPEYIVRDAGTAAYEAKRQGKARYQIFSETMYQQAREQLYLENDLRRALESQEFILHYQPIISLATGHLSGFEALVRWHHPERGVISPTKFIPIAEETGLIIPLGLWVLKQACQQAMNWQRDFQLQTMPFMSVNVSTKQFMHPDLIEQIDGILRETGMLSSNIKLEITESAIMENTKVAAELLEQLKARHIQLAIDDFGTGYSSLSYLHEFPVDTLKIDRSFISRLEVISPSGVLNQAGRQQHSRIVQSIINLAHDLGMNVVAEGVEVASQLQQLQSLQCNFGQGYFWAKPLNSEDASKMLQGCTQE